MFKKAKLRIVLSILTILGAVLLGTLGMIYISSYISVTSQNYRVLSQHADKLSTNRSSEVPGSPRGKTGFTELPAGEMHGDGRIQRHMEVGTFYTVRLSDDGCAEVIENGAPELYSDEELITCAEKVCSRSKGKTGELLYLVTSQQGQTMVCFMDNMEFTDSFTRVFLFTLLFGLLAMLVITYISVRIADKIISPMEETYQKQKQFTADAGHELKSPVAAMAANIELLQREIGPNRWLENIAYENTRMHDLITELLELSRNENKTADRKPTDLSHLVNSVILPLEASAFENHILIASSVTEGITANIDEKGIIQLVTILVDNAISHTDSTDGQEKKVSVVLAEEKGAAVLSVTNPGEEIPEAEREKLFERFYRTDSSHEFTGHYGLGLAIAKAIADANHARISVACADGLVTFTAAFSD